MPFRGSATGHPRLSSSGRRSHQVGDIAGSHKDPDTGRNVAKLGLQTGAEIGQTGNGVAARPRDPGVYETGFGIVDRARDVLARQIPRLSGPNGRAEWSNACLKCVTEVLAEPPHPVRAGRIHHAPAETGSRENRRVVRSPDLESETRLFDAGDLGRLVEPEPSPPLFEIDAHTWAEPVNGSALALTRIWSCGTRSTQDRWWQNRTAVERNLVGSHVAREHWRGQRPEVELVITKSPPTCLTY